jgi:hypothetical protein
LLTAAIAFPVGVLADRHEHHVHENLRKADSALNSAIEHLHASQRANEWREGKHAQEAIELIERAKHQVHEAAEYDDHK